MNQQARIRSLLCALSICLLISVIVVEPATAECGKQVEIRAGETLSGLAERCNITETRILDLNPNIEGSKDLRAGMMLNLAAPSASEASERTRSAGDSLMGRLKSYAEDAGETLESGAETLKQSVERFVAQNPDLHQRVRRLGQRLNIPGLEKADAQISLSVRTGTPGTPITLSAIGLPRNQRVEIAGGAPGTEFQILESARTSSDGTLQATVLLPQWADPQRDFIFVIASPQIDVAARSGVFNVEEPPAAPVK